MASTQFAIPATTVEVGQTTVGPVTAPSGSSLGTVILQRNTAGTGDLNSLTAASTLTMEMDYSPDGGTTWLEVSASTVVGGTFVTKGITAVQETLEFGIGQPLDGLQVRAIVTVTGTPILISGSLTVS